MKKLYLVYSSLLNRSHIHELFNKSIQFLTKYPASSNLGDLIGHKIHQVYLTLSFWFSCVYRIWSITIIFSYVSIASHRGVVNSSKKHWETACSRRSVDAEVYPCFIEKNKFKSWFHYYQVDIPQYFARKTYSHKIYQNPTRYNLSHLSPSTYPSKWNAICCKIFIYFNFAKKKII